jgi:hypothetical protein
MNMSVSMNRTERAMNALDTVMNAGRQLITEAMDRKADIKQGRLASEACGRVNAAVKVELEYRLSALKLLEIEAKEIEAVKEAEKKQVSDQAA